MRKRSLAIVVSLIFVFCLSVAYQIQSQPVSSQPTTSNAIVIPQTNFKPSSGNTKVTIPSLTITSSNGPIINATDILFTNIYDIKSNVENHSQIVTTIKNLQVKNTIIPIDGSINLTADITNVNMNALQNLILAARKIQSKQNSAEEQEQAYDQFVQILPQIVTNSTSIAFDKSYTTTEGAMVSNVRINYPANMALPVNSTELFNNTKLTVYFKIAVPLFNSFLQFSNPTQTTPTNTADLQKQNVQLMQQMIGNVVKQYLDTWIKQGYIVNENNEYIFSLTHEKGVFKINGKVIDIPKPGETPKPATFRAPTSPSMSITPPATSGTTTKTAPTTP